MKAYSLLVRVSRVYRKAWREAGFPGRFEGSKLEGFLWNLSNIADAASTLFMCLSSSVLLDLYLMLLRLPPLSSLPLVSLISLA